MMLRFYKSPTELRLKGDALIGKGTIDVSLDLGGKAVRFALPVMVNKVEITPNFIDPDWTYFQDGIYRFAFTANDFKEHHMLFMAYETHRKVVLSDACHAGFWIAMETLAGYECHQHDPCFSFTDDEVDMIYERLIELSGEDKCKESYSPCADC